LACEAGPALGDVPQNSGFICAVGRFHQAKMFSRLISAMPRSIQKPFHGEIQSVETTTSQKLMRKRFPGKNRSNNFTSAQSYTEHMETGSVAEMPVLP
jgi:hypothetical protein